MARVPESDMEIVEYRVGSGGYADVAAYDARRYEGAANQYKQAVMANAYRRLIGDLHGKSILDVGCGTGRGVIAFSREADFAAGCDASHDMLSFAAGKTLGEQRYRFIRVYAQRLPFKDATFDVVCSLNFLHLFSLQTQREMVSEMKRVLKHQGILVLEFDNALQGLLLGLYKRWFGTERGSLPHEISYAIGDDCRVAAIHGAVFPVVWRVLRRFPVVSTQLERISYWAPFNRLSHRIYYKVVKGK